MQWSKRAKEVYERECINFSKDFEYFVYQTFEEINKKKIKYNLEPKKRITKDVVEQTILNLINDTNVRGDIQKQEKLYNAFDEVMYQ